MFYVLSVLKSFKAKFLSSIVPNWLKFLMTLFLLFYGVLQLIIIRINTSVKCIQDERFMMTSFSLFNCVSS